VSAREIAVAVLLGLAGLVVVLAALGLVAAPGALARLHFVTPVTSVAGPLVGVAAAVDQGLGPTSGLVLLTVALLAATGPVLGAAVGRLAAAESRVVPAEAPE
jgi:multicomponent Na+:H+ antiporter subunit G